MEMKKLGIDAILLYYIACYCNFISDRSQSRCEIVDNDWLHFLLSTVTYELILLVAIY